MDGEGSGGGGGGARGRTATWLDDSDVRSGDAAPLHPQHPRRRRRLLLLQAMAQDYIFVKELVPFVASVLLKSCRQSDDSSDMEIILGGVASLSDELSWFQKEASRWDVELTGVSPLKSNVEYCRFLESFSSAEIDYTAAIAVFWAIETVYQDSFSFCIQSDSKTPTELLGTCQRWGSDEFKLYCQSLQKIADRCLEKAPIDVAQKAEEAFVRVLEHEFDFWNMSSSEH